MSPPLYSSLCALHCVVHVSGEENWDTTTDLFPVHPHVFFPAHHPRYPAPSRAYGSLMKATVDSLDSCKTTDAGSVEKSSIDFHNASSPLLHIDLLTSGFPAQVGKYPQW